MKLPIPWMEEFAILKCTKCGNPVGVSSQFARTWEAAENHAAEKQRTIPHACAKQWKFNEDDAKGMMRVWRARNPDASFEESCEVYNELMTNGTIVI